MIDNIKKQAFKLVGRQYYAFQGQQLAIENYIAAIWEGKIFTLYNLSSAPGPRDMQQFSLDCLIALYLISWGQSLARIPQDVIDRLINMGFITDSLDFSSPEVAAIVWEVISIKTVLKTGERFAICSFRLLKEATN